MNTLDPTYTHGSDNNRIYQDTYEERIENRHQREILRDTRRALKNQRDLLDRDKKIRAFFARRNAKGLAV